MCEQQDDDSSRFICARYMHTLTINTEFLPTLNVSIAALKRLVEARNVYKNTRLDSLCIHANGPNILEEDRAWFDGRLDFECR
jgi:hypothetical protein